MRKRRLSRRLTGLAGRGCKSRCIVAILALTGAAAFPAAQTAPKQRGVSPVVNPELANAGNGGYYALVIGIDTYRAPLPSLQTAAADAEAMSKILSERYGFQVRLMLNANATRANILNALLQYRRTLTEKDNLLIYYAGHGESDKEANKMYWLPADAEAGSSSNWIIADEITTNIRVQPARHVLIVSDSCYSGGLRDANTVVNSNQGAGFLSKMMSRKSRTLMASGGNEPVADGGGGGHSVFANAVLVALDRIEQDEFTAKDLFEQFVQKKVAANSDQVPGYRPIQLSQDDEGDFVFQRRTGAGKVETVVSAGVDATPPGPTNGTPRTDLRSPAPGGAPEPPPAPSLDDLETRYQMLSGDAKRYADFFEQQRQRLKTHGANLRGEIDQALTGATVNLNQARKALDQKQASSAAKALDAAERNVQLLEAYK